MNREEIHNLLKIENDKTTIFTNQELKMIDDYINELESYKYNMDRDYLRLEKENQRINVELREENKRLYKTIEELSQYERVPYTNEYVAKLENQQKEFIEYITSYIKLLSDDPDYIEEGQKDILEEILLKYKEVVSNHV